MNKYERPPLLIATNNKGKIQELQELLADLNIRLVTPNDINLDLEVIEDGLTYAENAIKKATAFAQASGLIALADDSGLEVDVLDGAPGLFSKRYGSAYNGGQELPDAERRKFLVSQLKDKPRPWRGRFRATIAIAIPNGEVQLTEGACVGEIIPEDRGTNGFGYDPIFLFPELAKTMAELSMDEKNRLSHRAKAVMKAKPTLVQLFRRR
jgi:XTP/dITP diphosphohydrolase